MEIKNDKKIQHTHDHDLTHSMVHYLLAIHKLKESLGYARVTDIAKYLNLTKGSVSTALTNLKRKKLIIEDDSRFLSLSELGHEQVHAVLSNRTLMYYFLKDILGLSEDVAQKDSCLVEHLMSEETREGFFKFMQNFASKESFVYPKISLDLSQFKSLQDFQNGQLGDSYLLK